MTYFRYKLHEFSDLSGTYIVYRKILRRFEVINRISDHLLNDQLRKMMYIHNDINNNYVFEYQILSLSGFFISGNVFELLIETVTILRNITGKISNFYSSDCEDFMYEYDDYDDIDNERNESIGRLGSWFDLSNIKVVLHHTDTSCYLSVDDFYNWLFDPRSSKTYSIFTTLQCSLFAEIWSWPIALRSVYNESYLMLEKSLYPIDGKFYLLKGTTSSNPIDRLIVIWRFYFYFLRVQGTEVSDLLFLYTNYDDVIYFLQKYIPVDKVYVEELRQYVGQAYLYVIDHPNVLSLWFI